MHLQTENEHTTCSKYILHFKDDWFVRNLILFTNSLRVLHCMINPLFYKKDIVESLFSVINYNHVIFKSQLILQQ